MDRRTFLITGAAAAASAVLRPGTICAGPASRPAAERRAVRIGLLLPLTGSDEARGRMAHNGALLAIDEINRQSGRGQNGDRRDPPAIVALVDDSRSEPRAFLAALGRMLNQEKLTSVFGLCPDGARDSMLQGLEKAQGLFWDAGANVGGECSKYVIHGGPTPHQSLKHLVPWVVNNVGPRLLLVGGGDLLGRELLRVGRDVATDIGAEPEDDDIILKAGAPDLEQAMIGSVVARARDGGIDAVLSTLSGEAAGALLRAWRAAGIDPRHIPITSPTLSELEVAAAGPGNAFGAIAAQPYFASWTSRENWRFMERMRRRHGARAAPNALAEAVWFQLHLFAEALGNLAEGDVHPVNIREAAKNREVAAPQGRVRIEGASLHAVLWPKIAVAEPSGRFRILARSRSGLRPLPFWAHPGKACTDAGPKRV